MGTNTNTNPEISITPPECPGFPLTKEFLELSFGKEVVSFEAKIGTNPGDNYLSIIHAVAVTFKGDPETKHYMIKCYPNHPGRRDFLDQVFVFEKEVFLYDKFLPKLKKLAEEEGAGDIVNLSLAPFHGGNTPGIPSLKFNVDPWVKENFLIMTDIRKTFGYTMADRIAGLDVDHAKLALLEIAKIHALTWAYKKKEGLTLLTSRYPRFVDTMYTSKDIADQFQSLMDQIVDGSLKAVEESIGDSHPAYQRFKELLKMDIVELMRQYTPVEGTNEDFLESQLYTKLPDDKDYVKDPWLVGNHGDCWVNNMMYIYDDQGKPKRITFVDFQVFREACPTIDLAYFLYASIRAPYRKIHQNALLRVYYDAFVQYCDALHVELLPGFTFETLLRRFRRAELFGLLVSMPLLNFILKPVGEAVDIDTVGGEDMAEVFSSVMEGSERNTVFRDEMGAIVTHLFEEGIL